MNPHTDTGAADRLATETGDLPDAQSGMAAPEPSFGVPGTARLIDLAAAERAISELLTALGEDLEGDQLRETPRRVAAAYAEMLTPRAFNLTTFPNDEVPLCVRILGVGWPAPVGSDSGPPCPL
jgi:hypothetical protein